MKNAQKPDHVSLGTLLGRIREGRYVIPDFQREFEWEPWDIRDLVRSIFLDYYIGSLLLWKGTVHNFDALSCEPIYGYSGSSIREHIVLDGQQRLTAMHYAFVGPRIKLPNRESPAHYLVTIDRFMAEEYDDAFTYEYTSKRIEAYLANEQALYADHVFPCAVLGRDNWAPLRWVQGYIEFWARKQRAAEHEGDSASAAAASQHESNARDFGDHLHDLLQQYQVSYIELDQELGLDKVCDIFTKLNSKGVRLDVFDLMNALLKPKGLELKHMWRESIERLEFVDTTRMNVYVLQVMSMLRQAYCSPKYLYFLLPGQAKPIRNPDGTLSKQVLVQDVPDFKALWRRAVDAIENAIELLRHPQEFGAISGKYLPYVSILPAFAALQADLAVRPPELHFSGGRKIRQWYWASVFTNRYSGSVESTSTRDFQDIQVWFVDNTAEPPPVRDFKATYRALDLRKEVKGGTSIYNGIFNLLVIVGARDWNTGNIPQHDQLDDHHIVPASWGAQHAVGNLIHSIFNRTPLTAETNRKVIGNQLPSSYLPKLISQNGEVAVRATLESHFISPKAFDILLRNPFTPVDFESFITERQRTIHDAIESLLIKERQDLPVDLRALDAAVEVTELKLRNVVEIGLCEDPTLLPEHILVKVRDRLQAAERKNPAFQTARYATLGGMLEYCDLRELQDTIQSKSAWSIFEERFRNKETLAVKFGQLAELRNGLRHSRTIDDITRKEGEAALLWFEQILAKP